MSELDTILFDSELLQIGTFRCPASYPQFENTGPISGYLIVFPRTSVRIIHNGRLPVVADPNVVMFYNKGQHYRRSKLSERGDLCDWFAFRPQAVVDTIRPHDPWVDDRWEMPFIFTHGPTPPDCYWQQRLVVEYLHKTEQPDQLYLEEACLSILSQVVENTYQTRELSTRTHKSDTLKAHVELVQAVKTLLAIRFKEPLSLAQIGHEVGSSPYHLCRVFRQMTGSTIHNYLNQIRLRTSLEYVARSNATLTELGLELGYSSHSHFTKAFRQAFGASPSAFRQSTTSRRLRQMSKILTA
ncbi:MAG TPA: helix-turn-helix transcriptional regulator [Anaerolineae bacterium]